MKLFMVLTALLAFIVANPLQANERKTLNLTAKNTLVLNDAFSGRSIAKLKSALLTMSQNLDSDEEILLVLDSPGGSVIAGKQFIDVANSIPQKVNTLTLFSASMAYQTVQSLGTRFILPSGILMSHRAYIGGVSGQLDGELESRISFYKSYTESLDKTASARVGIPLKDYKNLILNEYWAGAEQAVKENHADEIVNAKCDKSMMGTRNEYVDTIFGTFKVTFSKCPLISMPLAISGGRTAQDKLRFEQMLRKKIQNKHRAKL